MSKGRRLDTRLGGNESRWQFVGVPQWKQDAEGIIYPPAWPAAQITVVGAYSYDLAREDYGFLTGEVLADVELSVAFKQYYSSVVNGGVVFRAVDSARCYVADVEDMGRKGQDYKVTLWRQDKTGYRRELATGFAPHSHLPAHIVQTGPDSEEEWYESSPEWAMLRVRAEGSHIEVGLDGTTVIAVEDDTYGAGYVGLVARGPVLFKDLHVQGTAGHLAEPWTRHEGELPRFFYPGGTQSEGFNAFPLVCSKGETVFVAWAYGAHAFKPTTLLLTRSDDGGRTWTKPQPISHPLVSESTGASSLFVHEDGRLSCLISFLQDDEEDCGFIGSTDNGATWLGPVLFRPGGKKLSAWGPLHLYSPVIRLSDGTLVMTGYEADTVPGGDVGRNDQRLDRSVLFRSEDDGITWSGPVYFDKQNFDHNECMVAETEPGKLVAFMRTLRARNMWTSVSADGGLTWTKLSQSNISGECPYLLAHSSGALIMCNRGFGTFIKLSFDHGKSWTEEYRISPASAMVGMTEMPDKTVFIAMHEGYRVPGHIRGQFFRVTRQGPDSAVTKS